MAEQTKQNEAAPGAKYATVANSGFTLSRVTEMSTPEFESFVARFGDQLPEQDIALLDDLRSHWQQRQKMAKAETDAPAIDSAAIYAARRVR